MAGRAVSLFLLGWMFAGCAGNDGDGMIRRRDGSPSDDDAGGASRDAGSSSGFDAGMPAPGTDAGPPPAGTDAGPPPAIDSGPPAVCTPGEMRACMLACGAVGMSSCVGGFFGACAAGREVCNGLDDDCIGGVDDGFACRMGETGPCMTSCGSSGMRACAAGCAWGMCVAPAETCNGRDDDCVGGIDNGTLCGVDEACRGGVCARSVWTYEAEAPGMGHAVGRADADGWSASTGPDPRGTLVYGPYTSEIPGGLHTAGFRLMVDNNTADNNIVVRVEVNDFDGGAGDCGTCVIATRDIRRREFGGAMAYQDFPLGFTNITGHRLEFRTYWHDIAYVRQDFIQVR